VGAQATATLAVPVRTSGTHRVTRTSAIDSSVQYYAVVPEQPSHPAGGAAGSREGWRGVPRPALVLSLHGASVEAIAQAASYAAKPGFVIAAPTNRRPFGFDWEDWGRTDALETLDHARARFATDPRRQHVTGHSMGGHGSWQLGVHYPERFATIAPSAGWLSFETYMSALGQKLEFVGASPHADAFIRAGRASDTLSLMDHLRDRTITILHGDADDNVPVSEARAAAARLTQLAIPYTIHEQPGAGHWWDDDKLESTWHDGASPPRTWGATCTDWKPFFDAFAKASLDQPAPAGPDHATHLLDRNSLPKGSFKRAFANDFLLIYPTHGTPDENAHSYAKARYDAELWWVIGNGHAELIADRDVNDAHVTRNWIIYGPTEANRAWVYVPSTVRVSRGRLTLHGRTLEGDDLGALIVAPPEPLPDGRERLVAIVAGTGPTGDRALQRLNYFQAGAAFPEHLIVRADIWTRGMASVEHAHAP
jgi:dienelactone hydrolase